MRHLRRGRNASNNPAERQERDDRRWLLARARGRPASHPDAARAAWYVRLERALRALPSPSATPGWQARVFVALERRAARARRRAFRAGMLVAAALALVAWGLRRRPVEGALEPLLLAGQASGAVSRGRGHEAPGVASRPGGALVAAVRSGEPRAPGGAAGGVYGASLGETLVVKGWANGAGELRVYGAGGELALRCPGDFGCDEGFAQGRRRLEGRLTPRSPGRYRVVLLGGAPPALVRGGLGGGASQSASTIVDSYLVEVR